MTSYHLITIVELIKINKNASFNLIACYWEIMSAVACYLA